MLAGDERADTRSGLRRGWRARPTRVFAFVPVKRSLRPCVRLFAPLRDKIHLIGAGTGPSSARRIKRQLKVLFLRFESVLARFGLWLPKTSDSCVSMV